MSSKATIRPFLVLLGVSSLWSAPMAQEYIRTYSLALAETAGSPVCLEASIPADSIPADALYVKLHLSAAVEGLAVGDGVVLTCEALCRQGGTDSLLHGISDYFERDTSEETLAIGFDLSPVLAVLPGGCSDGAFVLHLEAGSSNLRIANSEGGPYAYLQVVASQ